MRTKPSPRESSPSTDGRRIEGTHEPSMLSIPSQQGGVILSSCSLSVFDFVSRIIVGLGYR